MSQHTDAVNHPAHYSHAGEFEPIKIIFALGWGVPFCLGNALKYIIRAGLKQGESISKDLRKAAFYLTYAADWLEKKEPSTNARP